MDGKPTLINSVQRALHLIDAVAASNRPVAAKVLARVTDQHLSTTYHLLRTLAHEGYLRREVDGYVLGDRIMSLTARRGQGAIITKVRPLLKALHEQVHAAAYLSLYEDGEIRLVDISDSPETPRADLWVGFHDAAHACALGKAVLMALDEKERRDYLSRHKLADLTPYTITDRDSLLRNLQLNNRVAIDQQEYAVGTVCAAVAMISETVVGAIAISVPANRLGQVLSESHAVARTANLAAVALAC